MTEKRKQKAKKGRVVRVQPELAALIKQEQLPGESVSECLKRMLRPPAEVKYVLPSDLYKSKSEARGVAVVRAVHLKTKETERPVPVRIEG